MLVVSEVNEKTWNFGRAYVKEPGELSVDTNALVNIGQPSLRIRATTSTASQSHL
jgi:hypothetical protein